MASSPRVRAAAAAAGDDDDDDFDDDVAGDLSRNPSSSSLRGMTEEERRLHKLARNQAAAKASRLRKKQFLEVLDARATALLLELSEYRAAHLAAATLTLADARVELLTAVEPLACKEDPTAEEEAVLEDAVAQLQDRFGPDCAERRAAREFHFDFLNRLLLPPYTKLLLWLAHQPLGGGVSAGGGGSGGAGAAVGASVGASSAAASGDVQSSLWSLVSNELGLSRDEARRLHELLVAAAGSPDMPRETWRLGVASSYLQRLRASSGALAAKAQEHFRCVAGILLPAQLVRYAAWVCRERNRLGGASGLPLL